MIYLTQDGGFTKSEEEAGLWPENIAFQLADSYTDDDISDPLAVHGYTKPAVGTEELDSLGIMSSKHIVVIDNLDESITSCSSLGYEEPMNQNRLTSKPKKKKLN